MSVRPLPDDPSAPQVQAMIDVRSDERLVGAPGDYSTAAVETMRADGSDHQVCIALEWPARVNHTPELRTVRMLISPDDAAGLAEVLAHTARWLTARATRDQLLAACLDVLNDPAVQARYPRGLTFAGDVLIEIRAKYGADAFPGATFLTVADVLAAHDQEHGQ